MLRLVILGTGMTKADVEESYPKDTRTHRITRRPRLIDIPFRSVPFRSVPRDINYAVGISSPVQSSPVLAQR